MPECKCDVFLGATMSKLYLLASTAAASHVQLSTAADHNHAVIVAALSTLCIRLYLDVVNVLNTVCLLPQLLDNLVDVGHLGGVESQQSLLKRLQYGWSARLCKTIVTAACSAGSTDHPDNKGTAKPCMEDMKQQPFARLAHMSC